MMGKEHMIVNSAIVTTVGCVCHEILLSSNHICYDIVSKVIDYFYPMGLYSRLFLPWTFALFLAMLLGTVLPDIDSKNSILGRYIYIPLQHRTWTHTFWIVALLFVLGLRWSLIGGVFVGYFLHLCIDAVSAAGICWFYPIQKYRKYPSGAFVAKNHKMKLYYAGKRSEKVFFFFVILLCIAVCFYCVKHI